MSDPLLWHRLQFAFTIVFHYLFPQLTMGLAPLLVILKGLALWRRDERYNRAARFWAKIFGISFLFGVITAAIDEIRTRLPDIIVRIEVAFDEVLAAISSGGIQGVEGSVSVDVSL